MTLRIKRLVASISAGIEDVVGKLENHEAVADCLLNDLRQSIAQKLPGQAAQRKFSHPQSYGRHFGPAFANARRAAVLVLIRWDGNQWLLPLTRRQQGGIHSGQICFPGGGIEPGESAVDAALRECKEETGWAPHLDDVVGRLSSLYVYGSNNYVSCVVAMTQQVPSWSPDTREVAEILEVPLRHLCTDDTFNETEVGKFGLQNRAPCFRWKSHDIWGATSMMISELKTIITS